MTLPLCQLPVGAMGRIQALLGAAEFRQRLQELGIGESTIVTKVCGTGPFLCKINGASIALGHSAAALVLVTPLS